MFIRYLGDLSYQPPTAEQAIKVRVLSTPETGFACFLLPINLERGCAKRLLSSSMEIEQGGCHR